VSNGIFATWAPINRAKGFWPRPITPGTKACHLPDWQKPDRDVSGDAFAAFVAKYGHFGLGLSMGSPFPDGSRLGAVDVDHDSYVPLVRALLGNPVCGRIGKKGIAYFVRVVGNVGNHKFKVKGEYGKEYGQVVECLFERSLCVIPPTLHPSTGAPYRWVGTPLHEIVFSDLPVIEP